MTTLGIMKTRINNEIGRDDLASEIGECIASAIGAYKTVRFFFSESREITFDTVIGQEAYTATDNEAIGRLMQLDYMFAMVSGVPYEVERRTQKQIEEDNLWDVSSFYPCAYSIYGKQIRIMPIPSDVWTIRLGGVFAPAAPASDGETDNPWMTDAERLIRCRAKAELYTHVVINPEKAAAFAGLAVEALRQLVDESAALSRIGDGEVCSAGYW